MGAIRRSGVVTRTNALAAAALSLAVLGFVSSTWGQADTTPPQAIDQHLALLRSPLAADRARGAHALGLLIGPESPVVVPTLIETLSDPEPTVRAAAAESLGHLPTQARWSASSVAGLLADPAVEVRLAAINSLGAMGPAAAATAPALALLLKDADPRVRRRAAAALGHFGEGVRPAIPALLEALTTSTDFVVRGSAVDALAQVDHPKESDDALRLAAKDPTPAVRAAAVRAFGKMGPEHADHVVPVLQGGLSDSDVQVRIETVHAAHLMGDMGRSLLTSALSDADTIVRWWALGHLATQGEKAREVKDAVRTATADPNEMVRRAALRTLLAIDPAAATPVPVTTPAPSPSPSPSPLPRPSPIR